MFISDAAIRRPVATIVGVLAVVVFGISALALVHTDEFPDVQPPIVVVSVAYPGAPPETVERELLEPIEERVSGISDVARVTSIALDSSAVLVVQFEFNTDMQAAMQDIRDEIGAIRSDLPPEIEEPVLRRSDAADLPVISLTLSSRTRSGPELTRLADPSVTRRLRGVPGVAAVQVIGGIERELTVELRPDALQAAGIGVAGVVRALQAQNLAAPVGWVTGPYEERTMRLRGRLEAPEDFGQLVVAQTHGQLVRLGQVAHVRDGVEEPRSAALFNDAEAIGLEIVKSKGASTMSVAEAVRSAVDDIQAALPDDVQLRVVRDAGVRVERSIADVEMALLAGAALTVIVVFIFLNSWRSTVITGVALPISVLASFIAVWAFGFTLNTMSLLGLSLAIGILIDDAIVVRENIVRHTAMGKEPIAAACDGTNQIGLAVTATTLAIVVVFVPVAFMGGVAEQWFAPFALTIASSVLVSLFVSFSVDPMLSAYWPDPVSAERRGLLGRGLGRFNRWFDARANNYRTLVAWGLDHRRTTLAIAVLSFIVAAALPAFGVVGAAFLPSHDISEFNVILETPAGSNLSYTIQKAAEVAHVAKSRPDVEYTYTTIGGSRLPGHAAGAVNEGVIYVRLKPRALRAAHQQDIERALRRDLQRIAGATTWVSADTFRNVKQIQVQLRGPDMVELKRIGEQVAGVLRRVPGAVDVGLSMKEPKPELDVQLDRPLAGALGVTIEQVAQALRPAFAGIDAGDWVDPQGLTRNVKVRLEPQARTDIVDVAAMPIEVTRPGGPPGIVLLGQVGRVTRGLGPARIDHLDGERVVYIQGNTEDRPLSDVIHDFNARVNQVPLPRGYDLTHGGERQDQRGVFRRILIALAIGVALMYLVHVVQFGSFLDPLPVIVSLPLSLVGAMLALLVTGSTLNIMSMIGLILLMGIVAKNAILLIDFAKCAEREGLDRRTAIIEAGRVRLRPILMTTFALIAGMVPVALGIGEGADFRAPLGRAVIGGVLTSTLLTLLVIPSVYDLLSDWRDRAFGRTNHGRAPASISTVRRIAI